MTTTDIDAAVAEHVMRWHKIYDLYIVDPINIVDCKYWHPSTDIGAAFEVVAEMQRRGYAMRMYSYPESTTVMFALTAGREGISGPPCLTPAYAICRAALAAIRTPQTEVNP